MFPQSKTFNYSDIPNLPQLPFAPDDAVWVALYSPFQSIVVGRFIIKNITIQIWNEVVNDYSMAGTEGYCRPSGPPLYELKEGGVYDAVFNTKAEAIENLASKISKNFEKQGYKLTLTNI